MKGLGRFFRRGQQGPSPADESDPPDPPDPPERPESHTLERLAKYIKDGKAKNIVVMVSFIVTSSQSLSYRT